MGELERVREISKSLRSMLVQVGAVSDVALAESVVLEPWESPDIDLSQPRTEEIFVSGVGLALQVIQHTGNIGNVKIFFNRSDGFAIDPAIDRIVPFFPIVKLYVVINPGASGILKFRVYKDPAFLFTATPEMQAVFAKLRNANDITINPATEDTLANLLAITQEAYFNKSAITSGQVTVGTTAVQLPNVSVPQGKAVVLKASSANTAIVYIGPSGVTTSTGFELGVGEYSPALMVTNLNVIYAISTAANQKLHYIIEQ